MMHGTTMTRFSRWTRIAMLVLIVGSVERGHASSVDLDQPPIWFKLDTSLAKNWEAVGVAGDADSVLLRRREQTSYGIQRHILSLQSRASSAYDVALSEAARVLEQKRILTDILVVNYHDHEDRAKAAVEQAERQNFDVILSTGSEATGWLWKTYRGGPLPVVSICAKDPVVLGQMANYREGTGTNFALTSLNLPVEVQLAYLLEVMPGLRNLAVIVDGSNKSAVDTQALPISALARARGIRVLNLTVGGLSAQKAASSNDITEELKNVVAGAVETMRLNDVNLTNSMFLITGSTAVFERLESINAKASRVPVISMVPETVTSGVSSAVLSIGVSFRTNAVLAAVYTASILDGRNRVGDLKVGVVTPPDIAINFRRAREIGLKIPFSFFESANVIYDNDDNRVRPNALSTE